MTPAIGPTAAWWWQGSKSTSPRSTRAAASGLVAGEPLEEEGADHRAAQRPGHALPLDRRAGVEQQVVAHAGDDVPRHARPVRRPGGHHALDGGAVGFVDCRSVPSAVSSSSPGSRPAFRRLPPGVSTRPGRPATPWRHEAIVEGLQADVDRRGRRRERSRETGTPGLSAAGASRVRRRLPPARPRCGRPARRPAPGSRSAARAPAGPRRCRSRRQHARSAPLGPRHARSPGPARRPDRRGRRRRARRRAGSGRPPGRRPPARRRRRRRS